MRRTRSLSRTSAHRIVSRMQKISPQRKFFFSSTQQTMPSIADPFNIAELPQSFAKADQSRLPICCDKNSQIHFGISGSSVVSYTLRPSPQLIWSHSISPTTKVTSICSYKDQIYFSTFERKRNSVLRVQIGDSNEESSSTQKFDVGTEGVVSLGSSQNGDYVYMVRESGRVSCIGEDLTKEVWAVEGTRNSQVVFAQFVELEGPADGAVIVVTSRKGGDKGLHVTAFGLNGDSYSELFSKNLDSENAGQFAYKDGSLFRFNDNMIQVYSIIDCTVTQKVLLPATNEKSTNDSIVGLGNHTALLCRSKDISLINTEFGTVLASLTCDEPVVLHAYQPETKTIIASTRAKNSSVVGISVDSGKGTLLESIAMGVNQDQYADYRFGMSDVIIKVDYDLQGYNKVLDDIYASTRVHIQEKLEEFEKFKEQNNAQAFDNKFVRYMKGEDWEDINVSDKVDDTIVYEESDRNVDHEFITEVVDLIFSGEKLTFVPEGTIIYLLTNPLFPSTEIENLIPLLEPHPRLLRQAVVTAPTLGCSDLVQVLSNNDDEIFHDAVSRMTDEFGQEAILYAINEKYENINDVVSCVKRLIRLNVGWSLISIFLDAGGLFVWDQKVVDELSGSVNVQVNALENTSEVLTLIDEALRKFDPHSDASAVGNLSKSELKRLSKLQESRTKKKDGPEVITEEERSSQSMLALGTPAKQRQQQKQPLTHQQKKKQAIRNAHDITRKVPVYTVEKLIL